jgi:hypothetical protein
VRKRGTIGVQWGADTEVVTGRRLVLLVALSTSRWGRHFRRASPRVASSGQLSEREREVVRLVAHGRTGPEIAEELGIAHDNGRRPARERARGFDAETPPPLPQECPHGRRPRRNKVGTLADAGGSRAEG